MIDHVSLVISSLDRTLAFYRAALGPLGYEVVMQPAPGVAGMGANGKPDLWFAEKPDGVTTTNHLALVAGSRTTVDAFHAAALAAGARDNGPPGVRPHYHPNYYAAFVLDPDGHNLEVVCHAP
ncbi:MAG: VOC family protein [Myxococcales bacterium]|nr:MAG: VOC family protein [Myxococcales bacterium]